MRELLPPRVAGGVLRGLSDADAVQGPDRLGHKEGLRALLREAGGRVAAAPGAYGSARLLIPPVLLFTAA